MRRRLEPLNGSLVLLPAPRRQDPPTLLAPARAADPFRPLLDTYGAVPYADVDPTPFVAVTYCLMFGMMFGDVGDGLVLLAARSADAARVPPAASAGVSARPGPCCRGSGWPRSSLAPSTGAVRPDPAAAGLMAGAPRTPHRLIAGRRWSIGVVLLAWGHTVGIVNRWREGGRRSR